MRGRFVGGILDLRIASFAGLFNAELIEHVLVVVIPDGNEIGLFALSLALDDLVGGLANGC
jgi:hypothetical protein